MSKKKVIIFKLSYMGPKNNLKPLFRIIRGCLDTSNEAMLFYPNGSSNYWLLKNSKVGELHSERIWYYDDDLTDEEIEKLRIDALKRIIENKELSIRKIQSNLNKMNEDIKYLETLL